MKKWPWFFWFLLKFVGLFNSRQVVTERQCHICYIQKEEEEEEEEEWMEIVAEQEVEVNEDDVLEDQESATSEACLVCQSEWWIVNGKYSRYSESEIGACKWNHCGSTVLSLMWPLALCLLSVYDVIFRVSTNIGQGEQQFRIISYATFKFLNVSIPGVILMANVYHFVFDLQKPRRRLSSSWHTALNVRYIVRHVQHLELWEHGLPRKPFLALCLIWPILTGLYDMMYYFDILDAWIKVTLFNETLCMLMYGIFCYLMLLLRLSFQKQLSLELAFLRKHAGKLDVCRRRVALYAESLLSICRFASSWILFVVVTSTWSICTEISWDYKRLVYFGKSDGVFLKSVNILVWSERLLFLILPLLAIGGVGLNDTWVEFKRSIGQIRSETQEMFWDKILLFCKEQSPVYKVATKTMVFSALGLFFGLKFGDDVKGLWPNIPLNTTQLQTPIP